MISGAQVGSFSLDSQYIDPGLVEAINEHLIDPNGGDSQVTQTYDLQANITGDHEPIYGLYQIYQVSPPLPANQENGGGSRELTGNKGNSDAMISDMTPVDDGSVSLSPAYVYLRSYQVVSLVKPLPIMLHLKVDPVLPDRNKYLEMPPSQGAMGNMYIPGKQESPYAAQIKARALEILAEGHLDEHSNGFEIVHQLELYLGKHYRYTLTPKPPPGGMDPILNFLFHQHEGYCTFFSSAMVMLCRSIGLPARMATGFATGEAVENPGFTQGTTYQVTSDDAHAWVEVFLPNYGWFTIDPTAGSKPVSSVGGEVWDSILTFFSNAKSLITSVITAVRTDATARTDTLLVILALTLALLGIWYLRRERPPALPHRTLNDEQARRSVLASYRRMHRWLRRWGVLKPDGVTASEFERLFREINPPMGEIVAQLTRLYLRGRYGARTIHDADARQAISLLQELWRLAPSERKHLYAQAVEWD